MAPPPDQGPEDPSQQNIDRWLDTVENFRTAPDQLGRTTFSRTLANALVRLPADRSVVTAVFGPWGCGKTWLLERIVESLEKDHKEEITVCRFSPWELKSPDQILAEFFAVVAAKLPTSDKKGKDLAQLWEQLGIITVIASAGIAATSLALQMGGREPEFAKNSVPLLTSLNALFGTASTSAKSAGAKKKEKETSLLEIKDTLTEKLASDLDRPILIVIDDLDRLTDAEIQLMIRLLNTTANLPKLHYLIFGDRKQIASALDPICGNQGDRYLEKLIQHSRQVPEPGEKQIRLRLQEGVEQLAHEIGIDINEQGDRFSDFWDDFLKYRLLTLRDCNRLLRTFIENTRSLAVEGGLAIDLLDLLGIDFLRIFDPPTSDWIAFHTQNPHWEGALQRPRSKSDNSDSGQLLAIFEKSWLAPRTACGALLSLFPNLASFIPTFLEENQLHSLENLANRPSPTRGVRNPAYSEIYFNMSVRDGDLPEARVNQFVMAMADKGRAVSAMREFSQRGWLSELFGRLRSEPSLITKGGRIPLLRAISEISDDLQFLPGLQQHELRSATRLTEIIVGQIDSDETKDAFECCINDPASVTLPLMLIEELRDAANCGFFPGYRSTRHTPRLEADEIEAISEAIYPLVERKFSEASYMREDYEPSRAYRMAHALGPVRTEKILRHASESGCADRVWHLINGIAVSIMPEIDIETWEHDPSTTVAGTSLLSRLKQFASVPFWKSFLEADHERPATKFEAFWLPHLLAAIEKDQSEPPEEEGTSVPQP